MSLCQLLNEVEEAVATLVYLKVVQIVGDSWMIELCQNSDFSFKQFQNFEVIHPP